MATYPDDSPYSEKDHFELTLWSIKIDLENELLPKTHTRRQDVGTCVFISQYELERNALDCQRDGRGAGRKQPNRTRAHLLRSPKNRRSRTSFALIVRQKSLAARGQLDVLFYIYLLQTLNSIRVLRFSQF